MISNPRTIVPELNASAILPSFPGFGIETTADKIGLAVGAATAAGVAVHAAVTNIRKRHLIKEEMKTSEDVKDGRAEQGGD